MYKKRGSIEPLFLLAIITTGLIADLVFPYFS